MKKLKKGDIVLVNLDPSKDTETKKTRPCLVISNNLYNRYLNTILIAPISSAVKYKQERYLTSPFFIPIPQNKEVNGTILLQHIRSIDPKIRVIGEPLTQLNPQILKQISETVSSFF